jgi:hypothetical protein
LSGRTSSKAQHHLFPFSGYECRLTKLVSFAQLSDKVIWKAS